KPRPEKQRKAKPVQPPLPGMPPPEPPGTGRILPMQLQVGDRFSDESGEWEVIGRPYTTAGGKNSHVRVQRVDKPGVTETRQWGSYEKITVILAGQLRVRVEERVQSGCSGGAEGGGQTGKHGNGRSHYCGQR